MYASPDALLFEFSFSDSATCRTYGALLMFFTGVFYLLFEHVIDRRHRESKQLSSAPGGVGSRVIMGMQVRSHLRHADGASPFSRRG